MPAKDSIVVIDDDEKLLAELVSNLEAELEQESVSIRTWVPNEGSPRATFDRLVDDHTILVVTDYDLTSQGMTGLFGASIVSWCQQRAIPAGNFSRGNPAQLPAEPDMFELRIPTAPDEASRFVASVFRGFRTVRDAIETETPALADLRSPAEVLAELLEKPNLATSFALYFSGAADTSGALIDRVREPAALTTSGGTNAKTKLLVYLVGHVLLNAVLRYPGPVLTEETLRAYVGVGPSGDLGGMFAAANYQGPFSSLSEGAFWRDGIDEILEAVARNVGELDCETIGEYRRRLVERALGRELERHNCSRCSGRNGGFWCPFTRRAICERADCSVGATSWIPAGADLARIERDFYDEWAPVLGL